MHLFKMNKSDRVHYLKRIKLEACDTNLAGLTALQEHHTQNIPFENLDIVVGRKITLDYDRLFKKVILSNRGGYCFELNVLFATLLNSFGFSVKPVLGRVWLSNPLNTPPRNHLALLVELDGKVYVTDVGFGGLVTRFPLDIHQSTPVNDKDGVVRVLPIHDDQFMVQRQGEKGWENQYSFETRDISEEDIEIAHYYMSTHPNSHLIHHKCVGRNTDLGRIGLFNNKFTIRKEGKIVNKTRVDFDGAWRQILENEFLIHLDFSAEEWEVLYEKYLENTLDAEV